MKEEEKKQLIAQIAFCIATSHVCGDSYEQIAEKIFERYIQPLQPVNKDED